VLEEDSGSRDPDLLQLAALKVVWSHNMHVCVVLLAKTAEMYEAQVTRNHPNKKVRIQLKTQDDIRKRVSKPNHLNWQ